MLKKQVLTTTEAAQYLHVHPMTIKRWIAKGSLLAYREPGGRWRIPKNNLSKFINKYGIPTNLALDITADTTNNVEHLKVIVADDDPHIREVLREAVESRFRNAEVIETEDGLSTCMEIGRFRPDLLLLDIRMPNIDGVKVAQLIQKQSDLASIRVIVISGYLDNKTVSRLKRCGIEAFLEKPFSVTQLLEKIEWVFGNDTVPNRNSRALFELNYNNVS